MPIFGYHPILANALEFALSKATVEGKITIFFLLCVSLLSWTVIFSKIGQLMRASKATRKFYHAYGETHDPLELSRAGRKFPYSPAYEVYCVAVDSVTYHLEHGVVQPNGERRMSMVRFDQVRVAMERATSDQILVLEKGMVVLTTAVAGGPFLGLLGTVWGVMETFSSIAQAAAASLTAMAPGVAGALIATVVGLFVAIPAMFAHNFMVTRIRSITQQMDSFASELAANLELATVDNSIVESSARVASSIPAQKTIAHVATAHTAPARSHDVPAVLTTKI